MVRLNLQPVTQRAHKGPVSTAGWSRSNELFTGSDDGTIMRWSVNGEPLGVACHFEDCSPIILRFSPLSGRSRDDDKFAVGCSDGTYRFCSATTGREEQKIDAHQGACCALAWNSDGSAIVTAGEDGLVRIWSAMGKLRYNLFNAGACVYSVAWNGDATEVIFTVGKDLVVKPAGTGSKHLRWRAHDGLVLQVDWSALNGTIVSCGEDAKYKVWDPFGRCLFASQTAELPITAVRWSPDGELFAVGGFGYLRVCDAKGWALCREQTRRIEAAAPADVEARDGEEGPAAARLAEADGPEERLAGSVADLAWGHDSSLVSPVNADGSVFFGQLVDRRVESGAVFAIQTDPTHVSVVNVVTDSVEELEQRDKIVRMALGFGRLILATTTQVYVYDTSAIRGSSPHVFDTKDVITLIHMCPSSFLTLDLQSGIRVFDYDGTLISQMKPAAVRLDTLNRNLISLSGDTVAVRDSSEPRRVLFLETLSGRPSSSMAPYMHSAPILDLALSQSGGSHDRKLVIIDKNKDMYIIKCATQTATLSRGAGPSGVSGGVEMDANGVPILDPTRTQMLASMVSSMAWEAHPYSETLCAVADHQLVTFYYPGVAFIDPDLLPRTRAARPDVSFELTDTIDSFTDSRVQVRRASDGAMLAYSVSPYSSMLFEFIHRKQWPLALRLCRFVKDSAVWAILAGAAISELKFGAATFAYSALGMSHKIDFIREVKRIPSPEGRAAAIAMFQRRPKDSEQLLVGAGLLWRAIKNYIDTYRWDAALRLSTQHKTHIDTVLLFRSAALERLGQKETNESFIEFAKAVEVDEDRVLAKIDEHEALERNRPGAGALPDEDDDE